jgi:hypothetical protein
MDHPILIMKVGRLSRSKHLGMVPEWHDLHMEQCHREQHVTGL